MINQRFSGVAYLLINSGICKVKLTKINIAKISAIYEIINKVFALKYFCKTQSEISNKKANKFQIHKKIQTSAIDFNLKVKK